MDSEVSGYSLKEANKLRKSIAKKMKNSKLKLNNNFLNMDENWNKRSILDYIWNVVFAASMGYSLKIFNLNYIAWLFN